MADGSVKIDVGLSTAQAEKDLARLRAKIEKAEAQLNANSERKTALAEQLATVGAKADDAKRKVIELKEQLASTGNRSEKATIRTSLAEATEEQRILVGQTNKISDEYFKVCEQIEKGTNDIGEMKEQAGQLAQEIAKARPGEMLATGIENAKKKLMSFLKYAVGIRSVFFLFRRLRSGIKEAVSAFAEYDDETKNTINGLKASLQQLKVSWGAAFAPILNAVAPLIQKFIGWLTEAANAVSRFFAIMSGKSTYKKVIVNTEGVADGMEDVAGAADDAADSVKEAKKEIMGFDELNVLGSPDEAGKSSAAKTGAGKGTGTSVEEVSVGEISPLMENIRKTVSDIKGLFSGDISFGEFLSNLNAVEVAILALGGAAVIGALVSFTSKLLGLSGAGATFGGAAAKIATGALAVADAFLVAYDVSKLTEAAKTYHEAQETHNKETESALETYRQLYEEKGKEVADEWAAMVYQIDTTNMEFEEAQKAIAETIETYWEGVPQDMWEGFKQGWNDYFGENGKGLWQLFKDAFTNVIDWTKNLLGIHSPSTVFEGIGESLVDGLSKGLTETWAKITSFFAEKIEYIKSLMNFSWSFPKPTMPHFSVTWTQLGKWFSIPNVSVSWYARGGVFDQASLIGVGENGKEAVVPLEKNTEWMRLVADGLMERLTQAHFADQLAAAFASTPMPAMAGGGVVPPRAVTGSTDDLTAALSRAISDAFGMVTNQSYEDNQPINVYIGNEMLDSYIVKLNKRNTLISGGR